MYDSLPGTLAPLTEYLTFGRRPYRLVRIWFLQIIIVFSDMRVFRMVHPWISDLVEKPVLLKVYVAITVIAFVGLYAFIRRMGQLTFDPRFQRQTHLALSMTGYLSMASMVMGVVVLLPAPSIEPNLGGGFTMIEFALASMMTVNLAALLAVGFYAQFDDDGFPPRAELEETIQEWLDALDWTDLPEGSREKEVRYNEFQQRTEALTQILEHAHTQRGTELNDEFEEWLAWFRMHGPLSQEAILERDVKNERLRCQRDRLRSMIDQLENVVDDQ